MHVIESPSVSAVVMPSVRVFESTGCIVVGGTTTVVPVVSAVAAPTV